MASVVVVYASVEHGAVVAHLVIYHLHPLPLAEIGAFVISGSLRITEVAHQAVACAVGVSARPVGGILHIRSHATVKHELSHSIALLLRVVS